MNLPFELGEKIKDSYTNEYIGREQKEVGKLEINKLPPNYQVEKLLSKTII